MTPSIHLHDIAILDEFESRSISPENPTGERGGGWKVRPFIDVPAGETTDLADISGPGKIESIWMTTAGVACRDAILRIYWDGQAQPSVECPLGDFFASAFTSFDTFAPLNSAAVCVNPGNAFNCYWPMPFAGHCRMTIENRDPKNPLRLFFQINYALGEVPQSIAYFHAQFRRVNPTPYARVVTILDGVEGCGRYVGTYLAWQVNNNRWWGEGEVKFYLDDDLPVGESVDTAVAEHGGERFPTICGTGTEDYFCGSYNFENKAEKRYEPYCTPYAGLPHVVKPDGLYESQMRFSMYRWHLPDPIRFNERIAVTLQPLGWRSFGRYLPLQDDIASVAYWYQKLPTASFPSLGDRNALEII
jgi:hypothetical protein